MSDASPVTLLRLRAAEQVLDVEWADGTTAALPYQVLRGRCPCAVCRQRRNIGGAFEVAGGIAVTGIVPCGPSAVQLAFSDGHDRGIFPFSYLGELHGEANPRGQRGH